MNKDKLVRNSIVGIFVALYFCVSIISTIHVIDFFSLSNPYWLAVSLAVAFEMGAAASLAAIIILDKTNRGIVWFLFILLTAMQCMGNMYFAYDNAHDYQSWMELFSLNEEEPIFQKRILAIISGAILPVIALGFIKSLVDYIRPSKKLTEKVESEKQTIAQDIIPVKPDVKPEIKPDLTRQTSFDNIDEDKILNEIVPKSESVTIETAKNDSMSNTLQTVEELLDSKETDDVDTGHNDQKAQVIKDVIDENNGDQQVEDSSKWPGQNIKKDENESGRTFGPPNINNGLIQ